MNFMLVLHQWRLLSSPGVNGSRGSSWPSARLQSGQGAGAAAIARALP